MESCKRTPLYRDGCASLRATLFATALLLCAGCTGSTPYDLPAASDAETPARQLPWLSRSLVGSFLALNTTIGSDSGYVAAFARDGRLVHALARGSADLESGAPMTLDTRFRMASNTKPVTAVAAMILIEEGRLGLDDPVERYVPIAGRLRVAIRTEPDETGEIPTEPLASPLTVRHLLTFSAGIGAKGDHETALGRAWAANDIYAGSGSLADRVDRILSAPLYEQPGVRWRYGWSADVLARVVEVAADEPFDVFLTRRVFEPLGMADTSFLPEPGERDAMATMYTVGASGDLEALPTPASDAVDWTPGGSGLVSTAPDYLRFGLMLWNRGAYDGVRILREETVDEMTRPHVTSGVLADEGVEGVGWGLGLAVVVDAEASPQIDHAGDFWWSGYYGTTFNVSPETGVVSVVLSQNQPSPEHQPYAVHIAQSLAFIGL